MNLPKLYRRRFIPEETVFLKDDIIVYMDDNIIITKWTVLKPRNDFSHGVSCYYINEGYKISIFINDKNECIYTYCDIIEVNFNEKENIYTFNDLLADVIIYSDGFVKVLDIEELPLAHDAGLITIEQMKNALTLLSNLLNQIYSGNLHKLSKAMYMYM